MPKARLQKHLPYKREDLITMVGNIERYPEFINLISSIRVMGKRERAGGREDFDAEMNIAYKFISETVRCHVTIDHDTGRVIVRNHQNSGPLKTLINDWTFHSLSDGTTLIDFSVDVTLKAFPLNLLVSQKFDAACEHIMGLFLVRASQECPKVSLSAPTDLVAEMSALGIKAHV